MPSPTSLLKLSLLLIMAAFIFSAEAVEQPPQAAPGLSDFAAKVISAALAFGIAAISAGFAIGKAGSAGLAAAAERPEMRTLAIIIAAFAEALAIYGIVIAFFVLAA